jgi:hypothetical protein
VRVRQVFLASRESADRPAARVPGFASWFPAYPGACALGLCGRAVSGISVPVEGEIPSPQGGRSGIRFGWHALTNRKGVPNELSFELVAVGAVAGAAALRLQQYAALYTLGTAGATGAELTNAVNSTRGIRTAPGARSFITAASIGGLTIGVGIGGLGAIGSA